MILMMNMVRNDCDQDEKDDVDGDDDDEDEGEDGGDGDDDGDGKDEGDDDVNGNYLRLHWLDAALLTATSSQRRKGINKQYKRYVERKNIQVLDHQILPNSVSKV